MSARTAIALMFAVAVMLLAVVVMAVVQHLRARR